MSQSQYHQLHDKLQARHQEQLSSSFKLIGYNNCTDEGKWNCSIPFSLLHSSNSKKSKVHPSQQQQQHQ
jgi:hypothetical protein